jgi:hypothetical protein
MTSPLLHWTKMMKETRAKIEDTDAFPKASFLEVRYIHCVCLESETSHRKSDSILARHHLA